jgi:hydrogenase maturation protease
MTPLLIIGCGNPLRGDDAAGLRVAAALRARGIPARDSRADPAELVGWFREARRVILVDALAADLPPGTVRAWEAGREALPRWPFDVSSHGWGLVEAIELARALGALPERVTVYGIAGAGFELGGAMAAEVQSAIERVTEEIAALARAGA